MKMTMSMAPAIANVITEKYGFEAEAVGTTTSKKQARQDDVF